jgi:hypothetical protein
MNPTLIFQMLLRLMQMNFFFFLDEAQCLYNTQDELRTPFSIVILHRRLMTFFDVCWKEREWERNDKYKMNNFYF